MSSNRDEFSPRTKSVIAARAGYLCSNPECRSFTSARQTDPGKAYNQGKAAHITAAAPGGPRYDPSLTSEQRSAAMNGIWLCTWCADAIDRDLDKHTDELLRNWKEQAERLVEESFHQRTPGGAVQFARVSQAVRFGLKTEVFHDDKLFPYAIIFDRTQGGVEFYASPAYVARFVAQRNRAYDNVLVSQIQCRVHRRVELTGYRTLAYALPRETSLFLVEIDDPSAGSGDLFPAEWYYERVQHGEERQTASRRFAPFQLDPEIPETVDVRFNAKRQGLYTISLEIVVAHGVQQQTLSVMQPTEVFFEYVPPFDRL